MNQKTSISSIFSPARILLRESVRSKKKVLEKLAESFAHSAGSLKQDDILDALSAREKLGSTSLDNGIALPHCRVKGCHQPMGALITLTEEVDFEARDGIPATIVCGLIVPPEANEDHLLILANIAQLLGNANICNTIRSAHSPTDLYHDLIDH